MFALNDKELAAGFFGLCLFTALMYTILLIIEAQQASKPSGRLNHKPTRI